MRAHDSRLQWMRTSLNSDRPFMPRIGGGLSESVPPLGVNSVISLTAQKQPHEICERAVGENAEESGGRWALSLR